MRRSPAPSN
jgi:CubicO group peptidase (beta-lactamase class C family)